MKACSVCRRVLPIECFGRDTVLGDESGRYHKCNDCVYDYARRHRNASDAPPRRRRSPYQNMESVLRDIETALAVGPNTVRAVIADARMKYALA